MLINELTDIYGVMIRPRTEELKKTYHPTPIPGAEILEQLGYSTERGDRFDDLYILGGWVVGALVLQCVPAPRNPPARPRTRSHTKHTLPPHFLRYLLLRFFIRDPH